MSYRNYIFRRRNPIVTCQNCGKGNKSGKTICWSCGFDLGATAGERISRIKRRAEARIPFYRRNVSFPTKNRRIQKQATLRSIWKAENAKTFNQLYYEGQLNDSWLYLLASLNFEPAIEVIRESKKPKTRNWSDAFERVDLRQLDATIPSFSNYFTLQCLTGLLHLIESKISIFNISAYNLIHFATAYLREYEFYPNSCHRVSAEVAKGAEMLESMPPIHILQIDLEDQDPEPELNIVSSKSDVLLELIQSISAYLNGLCGRNICPGCQEHHPSRYSIEDLRHQVLLSLFTVAHHYKLHLRWNTSLTFLIFQAFRVAPAYSQLHRAAIKDVVDLRSQEDRF